MTGPVDPELLPFSRKDLIACFAQVDGHDAEKRERFLTYYDDVIAAHRAGVVRAAEATATGVRHRWTALEVQAEKDERFWVVRALLGLLTQPDPTAAFAGLLEDAFGPGSTAPTGEPWNQALDGELLLRFEANLPSPRAYAARDKTSLSGDFLLPHQRSRAAALGGRRLEGATKVDSVLVNTRNGVSVVFEAKVLSDVSTTVSFDAPRNQLARLLDVSLEPARRGDAALEARRPDLTSVILLTPETFRDDPTSRLYGFLHRAYREDARALEKHLPHRSLDECGQVARRLGWTTWETVHRICPAVVPWIGDAPQTAHDSPSALVATGLLHEQVTPDL